MLPGFADEAAGAVQPTHRTRAGTRSRLVYVLCFLLVVALVLLVVDVDVFTIDRFERAIDEPLDQFRTLPRPLPRILYLVGTTPNNEQRVLYQRGTWAAHVNEESKVLWFTDGNMTCTMHNDVHINTTTAYDLQHGHNHAYKEMYIWDYVYRNKLTEKYDWFVKVDDDTYLYPPNLEAFVGASDANKALYFGRVFRMNNTRIYFAPGGAGYVLSKTAVNFVGDDRFGKGGWLMCQQMLQGQPGDTAIAACLEFYGILVSNARDTKAMERFHMFDIDGMFDFMGTGWWYGYYAYYGHLNGKGCCANDTVSFHYVKPGQMRALDIVYYGLRPLYQKSNLTLPDKYDDRPPVLLALFEELFFNQLRWKLRADSHVLNLAYTSQVGRLTSFLVFDPASMTCAVEGVGGACANRAVWECEPPDSVVQLYLFQLLTYTSEGSKDLQIRKAHLLLNMP